MGLAHCFIPPTSSESEWMNPFLSLGLCEELPRGHSASLKGLGYLGAADKLRIKKKWCVSDKISPGGPRKAGGG